jgi:hypothetical protein
MYKQFGFIDKDGNLILGKGDEVHENVARDKLRIKPRKGKCRVDRAVERGYVRFGVLEEDDTVLGMFQYNGDGIGRRRIAEFVDQHPEIKVVGVETAVYREYAREEFYDRFV